LQQVPAVQVPAQGTPQLPQLALELNDSQPLLQSLSQFAKPESQLCTQLSLLQLALPCEGTLQALPQAPQLSRVSSAVSQPFSVIPSQSAYFGCQQPPSTPTPASPA